MPNGLEIGAGFARGIERATTNFMNIQNAKRELAREDELFAIKKKQSDLELKELEFTTSPENIELLRKKQKAEIGLLEAQREEKRTTMDRTEQQIKKEMEFLDKILGQENAYGQGRRDAGRIDLPGFAGDEARPGQDLTLPVDWEYKGERVTLKKPKEPKKDYLLKIPPKEFEAKKKGFWSQMGDGMLAGITGGYAKDITEADRTTTITEAKRKYAAGEELSSEEATLLTMNSIKTKQDIEELLEKREQYEAIGVDVQQILDFFAPEEEE